MSATNDTKLNPPPPAAERQAANGAVLTPQQRTLREQRSPLAKYRELVAADLSLPGLALFELYSLLLGPLPGLAGLGLRSLAARCLFAECGRGCALGRSLAIRNPSRIALGAGVLIDDHVVLDVRTRFGPDSAPDDPTGGAGSADAAGGCGITLGDNSFIGRYSILAAKGGRIVLEPGANVSSHCRIATETSVEIGESTLIAAYAYIGPGNHQLDDDGRPIIEAGMNKRGGVKIGKRVWIGTRATILDGVTIGDNAVVGAHSLVRSDVPAGSIVAGTPARILRRGGEQPLPAATESQSVALPLGELD